MKQNKYNGFTLLEILIALFIFTIISIIMVSALHNVINLESHTEQKAERLRQLQLSLLIMSRDILQTVNRPILNSVGKEEPAFVGEKETFTLTHAGFANPFSNVGSSALQRVRYNINDEMLVRTRWQVLDASPSTVSASRNLIAIEGGKFEYLDKEGKFHSNWPIEDKKDEALPRAIRIQLSLPEWGKMSQLFIINSEPSKQTNVTRES